MGISIINVMKSRKCLMNGWQSYLAYIVNIVKDKKTIEDTEVVKKLP